MKTIAVFGSSRCDEQSTHYAEAYVLGRVLASSGYTVLSGGYGGSMAAVSRGAAEAGGKVIGVTCAIFDPRTGNTWLTEEIKAPTLIDRLHTMVERSDGFVGLRGGIGTLSEVTLVWSLLQTQALDGKRLVLLGGQWRPLIESFMTHSEMGRSIAALATVVESPAQVISALNAPPTPPGPPPLG